jgi:hypothetical protein
MFLDHDDVLRPSAVQVLLDLLASFPEAGAAHADHSYLNRATGAYYPDHHSAQPAFARLHCVPAQRELPSGRLYGRSLYHALLRGNLLQQPWAVDAALFKRLGGYQEDIRFCEDWELYLRVTRTAPIALTDQVISDHIVEGDNLHLSPDQAAMHQRVIERRLRYERFRSPVAAWVLRRRLAIYLKAAGDQIAPHSPSSAWCSYLRSFRQWPFDHVVAARLLLWPFKGLLTSRRCSRCS